MSLVTMTNAKETTMTNGPVTNEQIDALRAEAGTAGDTAQVALCERALAGDEEAREECARVIAEAAANQ